MSFFNNLGNVSKVQNAEQQEKKGDALSEGTEFLIEKNEKKDGEPAPQPTTTTEPTVLTPEQQAEEEKKKKIADLQFERSNLKAQLSALVKKKKEVAEVQAKLDEAKQVAANTAPGPLKDFYQSRIPPVEEELATAQTNFIAAGGQIQIDKLEGQIKELNIKQQQILFGDGTTTAPVATEATIIKKSADPKEVGKEEDVQVAFIAESEETKELLEAIKETESNEAITKSQFNVEKVKEELELAIAGKQQSGKVVIEDADNVDKSRLRSVDKLDKYLEDPIAFMGNYVWNYDILNPTRLVFRYAFPQNIIIQINKTTTNLVQDTIKFLNEPTNKQNIIKQSAEITTTTGQESLQAVFDYFFIVEFSKRVREYLEAQFPDKSFAFLENKTISALSGSPAAAASENVSISQITKNIRFFWLWWNQVFYVNTPIFKQKFFFTIDENNVIPVNCALYFLEKLYGFVKGENSIETRFNAVKADVESETPNLIFKSDIFKLDFLGQLTNTNNYINKKNLPNIGTENIVNVVSSPFFLLNFSNLSEKEKKDITNTKTVKKCKEVKDDKKETSLKLFYKEGNDNVLDKEEPETGLGCDTVTAEWKQAEDIIFSPKTIDAKVGRVNFKIPYYNKLMVQPKNSIPSNLDVYQQGLLTSNASDPVAYNKAFEGLSSEIILNVIGKLKDDILIDQALETSLDLKGVAALIDQYFSKYPNWGPQYIINNIPFFNPQDTPFFKLVMLPYIGAFNAGYQIDKRLVNTSEILQSYYINSNTPPENLDIYDSQVKYARSYNYDLSQIISFVDIKYRYRNPKLSVIAQTEFEEQTEDVTQGVFAATADTDPDALFGTGKITSKTVTFEFETYDINYANSVQLVSANDITSPVSYVDLPPPAPYVRVYPQRSVNNKVLLSFQKFSQSNKVERKIIPRKYWTEGWEDARKFFIEVSENTPEIFKNLAGDVTVTNADDEMFFAEQDIFMVKVYSSRGKKPTDILELEETKEINLFTDGFTTEMDMEPNNKYYFAAKFVSFTGLESYYSEVYEVELVDDGGTVFPVINIVSLEQEVERKAQIEFDKKFRIQPALLQQAPNLEKDDIGYLSPSVFTTADDTKVRFKIRLTSKSTGRKADFNIIYRKDFKLQSRDAGPLNLNRTTKDKVLISYKSTPLTVEDAAQIVAQQIAEEGGGALKVTEPFLNLVNINISADEDPTEPKEEVLQDSEKNICCKFASKEPLFIAVQPSGATWATEEPDPFKISLNPNEDEKKLNEKLLKIDRALNKLNDDEEAVFDVLKSMTDAEKCYMCRRQADYANPKSTLGVIFEQFGGAFDAGDRAKVINILGCKNFGYSSEKGNIKGAPPIAAPALQKCNLTVFRKDLKDQGNKQVKVKQGTLGKKFVPNDKVVTGGRPPELEPK
jgi:hypothetical protein